MARLTLNIDDKLDTQFRDMVYKTMGWREDNLITALEEAIAIWIEAKKVMLKNSEPWPEEEQALKDIRAGKTQMVMLNSEDLTPLVLCVC
jgi:hypothetical protein